MNFPAPRRSTALLLFASLALLDTPAPAAANDLAPLSDEFEDAGTTGDWSRIHVVEGWLADQLETFDIDTSHPGQMTMMPHTSVWFQDWRAALVFKEVTGDLVLTAQVTSTARDGVSVPAAQFSLGGLMIRTPRAITPETWAPGGENYIFLSLGQGDNGGTGHQFEVKTTRLSSSSLELTPASGETATLQLARLGEFVIALRQEPGEAWVVHRRYTRADFPPTVQVGIVTYTDWGKAGDFDPFDHNRTVLVEPLPPDVTDPSPGEPFAPDLISRFEFARYFRPTLPDPLVGLDLADPVEVPDSELLAFLGEAANVPGTPAGAIPPGDPLTVTTSPAAVDPAPLTLDWGPSCEAGDTDYAVYEGQVGAFGGHLPVACSTGGARSLFFTSTPGISYYLVVPHNGASEGSYGTQSDGTPRPVSGGACLAQLTADCPDVPTGPAGAILPGAGLTVTASPGAGDPAPLTLDWGPSCNAGDTDYAVYEGQIGAFDGHVPLACSTGGALSLSFTGDPGNRYYLVVPHNGGSEGSYGTMGDGTPRPASASACLAQLTEECP